MYANNPNSLSLLRHMEAVGIDDLVRHLVSQFFGDTGVEQGPYFEDPRAFWGYPIQLKLGVL